MGDNILESFGFVPVDYIPASHSCAREEKNEYAEIVKAFLETDSELIAKEYSSKCEAQKALSRFNSLSGRSDFRGLFSVSIRGTTIYLYRTEQKRICSFCNRVFISHEIVKDLWSCFCPECAAESKKRKLERSSRMRNSEDFCVRPIA